MKRIFSDFTALVIISSTLSAAVPAYVGFVNAVGLETKTDLRVDGKSVKPSGFPQGNYIESFGLPAGRHTFSCTNGDAVSTEDSVELKGSPAPLYVLYKVDVPQSDGKIRHLLRLTGIPGQPPTAGSRRFFGFYASGKPSASLVINGQRMSIPQLKAVRLEGGELTVGIDGTDPVHYGVSESGNFALILFDGSDGRLRQVLLRME
jgi:hypothetical protein